MNKTTVAKPRIRMSAKNKAFWALSPARKRVAIARDVIESLEKGIIVAEHTYFDICPGNWRRAFTGPLDRMLKGEVCEVCGIGAAFYSLVMLGDKITCEQLNMASGTINQYGFRPFLRQIFSAAQISLIECAFEKDTNIRDGEDSESERRERTAAKQFGQQFEDKTDRMIAIFKNLIRHRGTFKPEVL